MTGRLVDMAFTLGGKQRITMEVDGDFRETWDKLHLERLLDIEIKKHRDKRSLSANAYSMSCAIKLPPKQGKAMTRSNGGWLSPMEHWPAIRTAM